MQTQEKDNTIIERVQQASRLLRQVAYSCRQEYDELYQVAAEAALVAYDQAQRSGYPDAYLYTSIRNAIMRYVGATDPHAGRKYTLADHYQITSLDAPLCHDDPTFSLQDVIAEPAQESHDDRDFSHLYAALSSLPDLYRKVVCMRLGLFGYGVMRSCEIAPLLGISQQNERDCFRSARLMLREYLELLSLFGNDLSRMRAAIASLPDLSAQIVCMRLGLNDYTVMMRSCEIAPLLGISQGEEGKCFQRAKAMLREYTELLELVNSYA